MQALFNFMSMLLVPQPLSGVDEVKWDYRNGRFQPWKPKPVLEGFDCLQSWLEHAEEGESGNLCPAAPSPLLIWSSVKSGISGGSQGFPTHPAKQVGRDRALGPAGWKWPQDPAAPAREPGAPWRAGMKALDTWGSQHDGSCPMGCAGTGQAKECSASAPWGEERLFILFSLDFRLNLTHFIYRNCFKPLTRATLLIWVKERRIWPCDNFKVPGFMFPASLRYICKCWRILLDFHS